MTAALILAIVCVNETNWSTGDDCPAIYAVLLDRAERTGRTFERTARLYAPSAFREDKRSRNWIASLSESGERPRHWPVNLPWEGRYQQKWIAVLDHARDIVAGRVRARCAPGHWGASRGWNYDAAKARGLVELRCGQTTNAFWGTQ